MTLRTKDVQGVLKREASPEAIRSAIMAIVDDDTDILYHMDKLGLLKAYFGAQDVQRSVESAIAYKKWPKILKNMGVIRDYMQDEDLRSQLQDYHAEEPWQFYNFRDQTAAIFSSDFFKSQIEHEGSPLDGDFLKMFQLYFADKPISAFPDIIQQAINEKIKNESPLETRVGSLKESGFACGGMEKNYLEAVDSGTGICLVNGRFLAKYFHRKGDAKKLTLIADENYSTNKGEAIWEDFIYASSERQHELIMEAIQNGQSELEIDDLIIRPVRPMIGVTSEHVFNEYRKLKNNT